MASNRIKVLIVDDEPRLCAAWERLLAAQDDLESAGSLARADDMLAAVRNRKPDVVLLDLSLPGKDPLEAAAEVAKECPGARVLVYSGSADAVVSQRAADAGAWGLVDKLTDPSEIVRAIRRVAGGQTEFPALPSPPHRP